MSAAHTPGPWAVNPLMLNQIATADAAHEVAQATVLHPAVVTVANARLIAAAPDLLKALQWYEAKAVQMGRAAIHQDSKLMLALMKEIAVEYGAQARAAIAKATGDQP